MRARSHFPPSPPPLPAKHRDPPGLRRAPLGTPCYDHLASPLAPGARDAAAFAVRLKTLVHLHATRHGLSREAIAAFRGLRVESFCLSVEFDLRGSLVTGAQGSPGAAAGGLSMARA